MPHHRPVEIVIPDASLVVLVGAAGAGKSTFAARHFDAVEILSSDAYRALIAGDEADQRATGRAFARLHRDLGTRLANGLPTVVDATSVEPFARRALVQRARSAGVPAVAIVLDLPSDTVIARNAARTPRSVDEAVVRRHLGRLRQSLDGSTPLIAGEGFTTIVILRDPAEVDRFTIRRETGTRPRS